MPSELKTKEHNKPLEDRQDGSIKGNQDIGDLTGDPGVQLCQLCPGHIRLSLCGGEGDLGGALGELKLPIMLGGLEVVVDRRIPLAMEAPCVVSVIGVSRV